MPVSTTTGLLYFAKVSFQYAKAGAQSSLAALCCANFSPLQLATSEVVYVEIFQSRGRKWQLDSLFRRLTVHTSREDELCLVHLQSVILVADCLQGSVEDTFNPNKNGYLPMTVDKIYYVGFSKPGFI